LSKLITETQIIEAIRSAVEPLETVNAMWIGGSHAFGENDEYSDIDIDIDIADGTQAAVFADIEESLNSLSPVLNCLDATSEQQWEGHHKRIYRLRDAPEWLLVDLLLKERNRNAPMFLEREIHGEKVVIFDKLGIIRATCVEGKELTAEIQQRISQLRLRFELFSHFPKKELLRGRYLDALFAYRAVVLRPLIEALRARYSPFRHDWGPRYLKRDLPDEVYEKLQTLTFVADEQEFQQKLPLATDWARQEINRLTEDGVPRD